jgi:hypothetical protein
MSDDNDRLVAVIGCGLLSPVLDRPVDVRKPSRLTDHEFDRMVRDLFDQGLIATGAVENDFVH